VKKLGFIFLLLAVLLMACGEPSEKEFTVSFNSDGGSAITAQEVAEGELATQPADPEKNGYIFEYWYFTDNATEFSFSAPVTADITLIAKWEVEVLNYLVSFNTDGGTLVDSQTIQEGQIAVIPTEPTKEGYLFQYWYASNSEVAYNFESAVTENTILTALWEEVMIFYSVTFNTDGGSLVADQRVQIDNPALLPDTPTKVGFEFLYWYTNDSEVAYNFDALVTDDVTLTALWFELTYYEVTFVTDGGTNIAPRSIVEGELLSAPTNPTRFGFAFQYWYQTDILVPYDFSTPITEDATLTALWVSVPITTTMLIEQDIQAFEDEMFVGPSQLNLMSSGKFNQSSVVWTYNSKYVSNNGIVLPVLFSDTTTTSFQLRGDFTLSGTKITKYYQIPLYQLYEVEISNYREVEFKNLTTEYEVADGYLSLYFEEDGNVPYVNIPDFFDLLQGFIDPAYDFTYTYGEGTLEIFYQYYDEDEDITYDLIFTIDAEENTATTNDPGFFWAYVYSTETNYGRHINYDTDNPNAYSEDGDIIVYDFEKYGIDITTYEEEILMPFYLVNQLFAGSSYYNVYYNNDGLYGIYSLPESGSTEYRTIKRSAVNNTDIPSDLLVHNFNLLAFNLDYFYGLKEIMGVDTYYEAMYTVKNSLLSKDPEIVDTTISNFLLKTIDEPHTSYGYPGYYNSRTWGGPSVSSLTDYGSRFVTWYYDGFVAVDDVIEAKWGRGNITSTAWAATSPNRPYYWSLDDKTVMLTLDDFYTADIEESAVYDPTLAAKVMKVEDMNLLLPAITGGTKFFYYNNSSETNRLLEILVKGMAVNDLALYQAALVSAGYTYFYEVSTNPDKQDGYLTKTILGSELGLEADVTYMVQIRFDEDLNLMYIGIMDKAPLIYSDVWPFTVGVLDTVLSDSAVYMEMMLDQITGLYPNLENIILDLSWNTGGNVGALYRIVGFITDQPFRVSGIDGDTGGVSSSYVYIDGIPSYSHLNWSLLITPVTFSAANSMATIFKENNLGIIIGKQSGGGACSITPVLLPSGTAFTMSSNNINAYRIGTGTAEDPYEFIHNEFGIAPDYPIAINLIYHSSTLLDIIYND
jgi:uncharacterized repeat protein (TIGR02543 family)